MKLKNNIGFPQLVSYVENISKSTAELVMKPLGMSLQTILKDLKGEISTLSVYGIMI